MRVLIAPDSFTGSMTAARAAQAMALGWQRIAPDDHLVQLPMSDGGPGFVGAVAAGLDGRLIDVPTSGAWGEAVTGQVLLVSGAPNAVAEPPTAYIEAAQAAGGSPERGDPTRATSRGVAELIRWALAAGARRIVLGLGGTLVTDGGAGLLAGLGATARDVAGRDATAALLGGGGELVGISTVDLSAAREILKGTEIVIASDVDSPLLGPRGAAHGFALQKGASAQQVEQLEESLRRFAHACGRLPDGRSPAVALGAGAGGGLGFALLHLGGRRVPGIESVLAALDVASQIAGCDLVLTGEGRFDWQSLHGKVVLGVCRAALEQGRPVLVLAGQVAVGRREHMAIGASATYAIVDEDASPEEVAEAMADGPQRLADLAERAARTWAR